LTRVPFTRAVTLAAAAGAPVGAGTRTGDGVRALGVGVAEGSGEVVVDSDAVDDAVAAVGAVLPVWVGGTGRPHPASPASSVVAVTATASTRVTGKVSTS
jgi:hypothetical protein